MIPVFRPSLDFEAVTRELKPVVESGWLGMGPKVEEFERQMAARVNAEHFIALNSCTAALHLALRVLNLPKGARVLTTPITFISTNAALLWEGLTPVFGAVSADTGLLADEDRAHNTVATLLVHLAGARAQRRSNHTVVIEDCAHALGAPWLSKGQDCLMRCWSFHAVKNLPVGDGGGISTNDAALAERLQRLRWMGISKSTHARNAGGYTTEYEIPEIGFKYHMNDISAAIGLAALPKLDEHNARRLQIAQAYREAFPDAAPPYLPEKSACHFYPLFFADRAKVEARLQAAGIGFSRHYRPNFLYPDFRGFEAHGAAAAMKYFDQVLVLPIFPSMTNRQVEAVIKVVRG